MKSSRLLSMILLTVLLTACKTGIPSLSNATPSGPQARVVDLINQVEAHATVDASWAAAAVDMVIYEGGEVHALEASTARLRIEQTLVRVAPNTVFSFSEPSDGKMQIVLESGQIWLNVEGLEAGQEFEVQTPTAVGSVRGTRFSARVEPDGSSLFSVVQGTVDVTGVGVTVSVLEGRQSIVAPGQPPSDPETISLPEAVRWGMGFGPNLDVVLPAYGEPVVTQEKGLVTNKPFFSPDGQWLLYHIYDPLSGVDSYNSFWNLDTGQPATSPLPEGANQVSYNPLNGQIAYAAGQNICTSQLDGSAKNCFGGSEFYQNVNWSPDGQWLLYNSDNHDSANLYLARPDGSEFDLLAGSSSNVSINGSWSPDGSKVAYVQANNMSDQGQLWVVNMDGSNPQKVFEGIPYAYDAKYSWQPDGMGLAVAGADSLSLVQLDGSNTTLQTGHGVFSSIVWSPNASGWPLFYSFKPSEEDTRFTSYLSDDGQSHPVMLGNWQYGPYWTQTGDALLVGNTNIVYENGSELPSYNTEFYRFPVNNDFLQ